MCIRDRLYPTLAATVAPSPYQITQEDIDNALLDWHNNLKGKQEVALYMPVSYTHLDVYKRQGQGRYVHLPDGFGGGSPSGT